MVTKAKSCEAHPEISVEDFLIFYYKAYRRDNIEALSQLHDLFPEVAELAFDEDYIESRSDPADKEYMYRHPIVIATNRMTESRVLDMVSYLLGQVEAPGKYKDFLKTNIAFKKVFNYMIERYQRDYDKTALWDSYFMELPELRFMIERRYIRSLEELVYRASNYFEDHQ